MEKLREGLPVAAARPVSVRALLGESKAERSASDAHVDQRMEGAPDPLVDDFRYCRPRAIFAVREVTCAQTRPQIKRAAWIRLVYHLATELSGSMCLCSIDRYNP